jgi:hypothetical protein
MVHGNVVVLVIVRVVVESFGTRDEHALSTIDFEQVLRAVGVGLTARLPMPRLSTARVVPLLDVLLEISLLYGCI